MVRRMSSLMFLGGEAEGVNDNYRTGCLLLKVFRTAFYRKSVEWISTYLEFPFRIAVSIDEMAVHAAGG